jgi:Ca2+-binding RTX toxin-like protein
VLDGGSGRDKLSGDAGNDAVRGGAGVDTLGGAAGNDRVDGGAGRDYIFEDAGSDRIQGGTGRDYLSYSTWRSGIRVVRAAVVRGAGRDSLAGVETIEGTRRADVMGGTSGDDDLRGLDGADRITGRGGEDYLSAAGGTLRAGRGNDIAEVSGTVRARLEGGTDNATILGGRPRVLGGAGSDLIGVRGTASAGVAKGGPGYDQISLLRVGRSVTADIGSGVATWKGGGLTFAGVVNLIGSRRADVITGSAAHDVIYGRSGDDVLRGRRGNDVLRGQVGQDDGVGGQGFDSCRTEVRVACEL